MSVKTGRIFTIRDFFFFKNLALSQASNAVEPRYTAALPGKSRRDSATGCILFTNRKRTPRLNPPSTPHGPTSSKVVIKSGGGAFFCLLFRESGAIMPNDEDTGSNRLFGRWCTRTRFCRHAGSADRRQDVPVARSGTHHDQHLRHILQRRV